MTQHIHEPLPGTERMESPRKGWMRCVCGVEHSGPWWVAYQLGVHDVTNYLDEEGKIVTGAPDFEGSP